MVRNAAGRVRAFVWCLAVTAAADGNGETAALVRDLADPRCDVREEAYGRLSALVLADPDLAVAGIPAEHSDPEVARRLESLREAARHERWKRTALAAAADDPELEDAFERILAAPAPQALKGLFLGLGPAAEHRFDPHAVALFAEWYLADRDPEMRKAALGLLGVTRQVRAAAVTPLFEDPDPEIRLTAIRVSQWAGGEAVPAIRTLLADPDTRVCIQVIQSLGKAGYPFTVGELAALLADKRHDVRRVAVQAVPGEIPGEVIPILCELGEGAETTVRGEVLTKLGRHLARSSAGEREILDVFEKAFHSPVPVVRGMACSGAGMSGRPELRAHVIRALDETDVPVVIQALSALGEWARKENGIVPMVAERLFHDDPRVSGVAAQALGRMTGKKWQRMDPDALEQARAWWAAHKDDTRYRQ